MNKLNKLTIGVTGTGSLIGQAIIKSIKASTIFNHSRLIGMDYFENTVGSFWCDKNYILPDLLKVDLYELWKENILDIISKNSIQILFIGVDFELLKFASLKKEIEDKSKCKVIVSDKSVIEIADDKYLTFQFLKDNGLFYPQTYTTDNLDLSKIEYPCIVKPRIGFRSRDVYKVESESDLLSKIKIVKNPIIQELVGTPETEYTCGVVYLDKAIGTIALRRELKEGNTSIATYENNIPDIIHNYLNDISIKLKPFGACNFQLRMDKNGIPKLFEINARHSGTTFMRAMFGFNEVEIIIGHLLGITVPEPILKEGKVIRFFDEMYIPKN